MFERKYAPKQGPPRALRVTTATRWCRRSALKIPLVDFARLCTDIREPILAHGPFHLPPHFLNLVLLFGHQSMLSLETTRELGHLLTERRKK